MAAPWASGAKVKIVGRIHGQQTNNVMHFATNTVISDPTELATLLTQLAAAVLACVVENLADAVTSDWTLDHVEAQQIFPVPSDPVVQTPGSATAGALSATSVSFAASLVHVRTGIGGRRGRGRIFFPPAGEAQTANSVIDASVITDLQAMLACIAGKFIGISATEQWRLGVLSRTDLGGNISNFNTSFREAISLEASNLVAVIGSRKVGRGA